MSLVTMKARMRPRLHDREAWARNMRVELVGMTAITDLSLLREEREGGWRESAGWLVIRYPSQIHFYA